MRMDLEHLFKTGEAGMDMHITHCIKAVKVYCMECGLQTTIFEDCYTKEASSVGNVAASLPLNTCKQTTTHFFH